MQLPLYWVDAFTSHVFAGNPAGVVPLERWPEPALMQRIAFENGFAETAFLVATGPARYHLRWFTPTVEMDLCGHATLAAAFVLFHHRGLAGDTVTFDTRSGALTVTRRADGRLELDFPSRPATALAAPEVPAALVAGLGAVPAWVGKARDYLCVYATADEVRALQPNFDQLATLNVTGIIASAPGTDGVDFVSRFFAPSSGVPEDPVTGSAHCTLIPYWAARLGKTHLQARQISARGGELHCGLAGDRVKIAGHAVLYLRGELQV